MRGKGRSFLDSEISKMIALLTSTDMSITEIATRMRCSVSAVNSLNRRMNVRQYDGRRTSWKSTTPKPGENRNLGSA